jgi:IS5 family transposase
MLMPEQTARANAARSAIHARIEHVFRHKKTRYDLFIRTIGIARAQAKLTRVNLAYNFDRLIFQGLRSHGVDLPETRGRDWEANKKAT